MRGFHEAREFGGWKQSYVAGAAPPDYHCILLVDHLVEDAGQVFTKTRICCFPGHGALRFVLYRIAVRQGD